MIIILFLGLFCGGLQIPGEICGGYGLPDDQFVEQKSGGIQFRRKVSAILAPDASGSMALLLECRKIGKNAKPLTFTIKELNGKVWDSGSILPGERHVIDYANLPKGVWHLAVDAGRSPQG